MFRFFRVDDAVLTNPVILLTRTGRTSLAAIWNGQKKKDPRFVSYLEKKQKDIERRNKELNVW